MCLIQPVAKIAAGTMSVIQDRTSHAPSPRSAEINPAETMTVNRSGFSGGDFV